MNLETMMHSVRNLSDEDKLALLIALKCHDIPLITENERIYLASIRKEDLRKLITQELKKQKITYEEMAMQIGVSIATFKRIIAEPFMTKVINLHTLLNELGLKVCLEK